MRTRDWGALSAVLCGLGGSACSQSHETPDAPIVAAPLDASRDASSDTPPDADPCGTVLAACADDGACDEGQMCFELPAELDAGVAAVCVPMPRGSCSWGGPCPDPTDECHENRLMTDGGQCFEPAMFRCLCLRSIEFADLYECRP